MVTLIKKPQFVDSVGDPMSDNYRRTHHYQVVGTIDEGVVWNLVRADLGPYILSPHGMLFRGPTRINQTAYNWFDADIDYIKRQTELGTWGWDGDGTGTTEHITHGIETVATYPAGQVPDYKNAIGFDGKEIKGTDVVRPSGKVTISFSHPSGVMTLAYFKYLCDLAGYMNDRPWLVWGKREVRYLGPRCSDGSNAPATCFHQLDIQRTRTNFSVGGITGINKYGWDVAWTRSKLAEANIGGNVFSTKIPQHVVIVRVNDELDFATALGIS